MMLWFKCNEIIPGVSLAVLFISVCLGVYLAAIEFQSVADVEQLCSMAEGSDDKINTFREAGSTAFVLGYTGETGKRLIKELAKDKLFKKVVLIGRREVELTSDFGPEFYPELIREIMCKTFKVVKEVFSFSTLRKIGDYGDTFIYRPRQEQKKVDFEKLEEFADVFKGLDVGFCCIGTTKAASGEKGFVRVDHDYVLSAAQLAKAGGTKHFQVMSTYGASHNSSALYTRTKGQVEEALKVMHFDRLSIFRPAVLMVDRNESRPLESLARFVLVPVAKLFPTAITTPIDVMVRAMINNVVSSTDKTVETFENKAIHLMSGISSICPKESSKKK